MYEDSIHLLEMPEHDSISVCAFIEKEDLFAVGERIQAKFEPAYMNGYNWEAIIKFYLSQVDPELLSQIGMDPEAGMFSAYTSYSDENLAKMKKLRGHLLELVGDEPALMQLIADNVDKIEWD